MAATQRGAGCPATMRMRDDRRDRPGAPAPPADANEGADGGLARLVAALLRLPVKELRLPPQLMQLYLESRWGSRREMLVAWALAMAGINALCMPFDPFVASDGAVAILVAARGAVSAIFLALALGVRGMARTGWEGPVVIAACVAMVAIAGFAGMKAGPAVLEWSLAQAMLGGACALVVARIAWRDTIALAWLLVAALVAVLAVAPEPGLAIKLQIVAFYGAAVVGLTLTRRAQNRFLYHAFLLGLSERLKITEVEQMNDHLAAMARTDPLTALSNRRHFDEVFGALKSGAEADAPVALFMIDIDCFKGLNDELGHGAGDDCLRIVAGLIRGELREEQDFLARFGGEEFVALLPDVGAEEASVIAERVRAAVCARGLRNPVGRAGVVTVSVGVALAPPGAVADLVAEADAALYEAKALGRNKVRVARSPITARGSPAASPIAAAESPR